MPLPETMPEPHARPRAALSSLRVIKKLAAHQNGAKRFARRYGPDLVCVRHRLDSTATVRYTTVEIVVEKTPIATRSENMVAVKIGYADRTLRALLIACGADWNSRTRQWTMPRRVAKNLKLQAKIVPVEP